MKYACKSEGIAKQVGQYTCPINPYSGHIAKAEFTEQSLTIFSSMMNAS